MIINICFLLGAFVYVGLALTDYWPLIRDSKYFYPVGMSLNALAGFIWLYICRRELNPSKLLMLGLYWDIMLTSLYMAIPLLLFGAKMTWNQALGAFLVMLGFTITKI